MMEDTSYIVDDINNSIGTHILVKEGIRIFKTLDDEFIVHNNNNDNFIIFLKTFSTVELQDFIFSYCTE